ncbi:hypothetical protein M758_1G258900 [Ceratodon purpureus]|nr:hypothetical protein M758_1G258900 [Ceratodon purpureus]
MESRENAAQRPSELYTLRASSNKSRSHLLQLAPFFSLLCIPSEISSRWVRVHFGTRRLRTLAFTSCSSLSVGCIPAVLLCTAQCEGIRREHLQTVVVYKPNFSDTDSNLVNTRMEDETPPTPNLGSHQDFLYPLAFEPGLERRSLKKSSSSGSKSKSGYKTKSKPFRWRGQPPSLWGFVIGVGIVLGILTLCFVFLFVTEKREKDPKWHVRTFFRRRLKRQYTIKGIKAGLKSSKKTSKPTDEPDQDDIGTKKEKPNVEKKLPEAGDLDATSDPIKASLV